MSSSDSNELTRRIENMLRPGVIAQVDAEAARVRVQSGELLTDWLPWFEHRAGNVRTWSPPSVGEQCLLLAPGGELLAAAVLVGLFSDEIAPAVNETIKVRIDFPDGGVVEVDHDAHSYHVNAPSAGELKLQCGSASLTLTDGKISIVIGASSITLDSSGVAVQGSRVDLN